jgi:two-component sensor histidine kinase
MAQGALIQKLLSGQEALAEFSRFAFHTTDLQAILGKAALMCATCVDAPFCKVCRFRPEHNDLLIEAGFGWPPDIVGKAVLTADRTSPAGLAWVTRKPAICANLTKAKGFMLPSFYAQHDIVSTVSVIIQGSNGDRPYGVLEIDSPAPRKYRQHDIGFLTGFANVLAEAVATARRVESLRVALAEKEVLSRELQHRVRNNLHLIYAMLNMEAQSQPEVEQNFRTIANRVQALATVYDHLLGTGLARNIAFDLYLEKLCDNLRRFQPGTVRLIQHPAASVMVDLDTATAMGIAITELITNSYNHAFPDGKGTIEVALDYQGEVPVLIVQDNGIGIDPARPTKRNGLGLVQRLAEQVSASVEIRRTQEGTRCEIVLPRVEAA